MGTHKHTTGSSICIMRIINRDFTVGIFKTLLFNSLIELIWLIKH